VLEHRKFSFSSGLNRAPYYAAFSPSQAYTVVQLNYIRYLLFARCVHRCLGIEPSPCITSTSLVLQATGLRYAFTIIAWLFSCVVVVASKLADRMQCITRNWTTTTDWACNSLLLLSVYNTFRLGGSTTLWVNCLMFTSCKLFSHSATTRAGHLIECVTHADHLIAFNKTVLYMVVSSRDETQPHRDGAARLSPTPSLIATLCTLWPCDLYLWPFDLILIGGRGIVMDYPCAKFGDFSFSRFGFIVRTDKHTDTESQTPLNALLPRLSEAWVITIQRCPHVFSTF